MLRVMESLDPFDVRGVAEKDVKRPYEACGIGGEEETHLVERHGDEGRRGVAADHVDLVEQRPDEDFERHLARQQSQPFEPFGVIGRRGVGAP